MYLRVFTQIFLVCLTLAFPDVFLFILLHKWGYNIPRRDYNHIFIFISKTKITK